MGIEQTFVLCLALHVIADYTLQTVGKPSLADLKQKRWWDAAIRRSVDETSGTHEARANRAKAMKRKYGRDYIAALACHGLLWAVVTFLPLCTHTGWSAVVAVNAFVHCVVDDMKANVMTLNLVQDQILHALQVVLTLGIMAVVSWLA